jgi:hypothetical protein
VLPPAAPNPLDCVSLPGKPLKLTTLHLTKSLQNASFRTLKHSQGYLSPSSFRAFAFIAWSGLIFLFLDAVRGQVRQTRHPTSHHAEQAPLLRLNLKVELETRFQPQPPGVQSLSFNWSALPFGQELHPNKRAVQEHRDHCAA